MNVSTEQNFDDWIGRETVATDAVTVTLNAHYQSIFTSSDDDANAGSTLGVHWCLSPLVQPMDKLGADGHPEKGVFLPSIPLPRRMWAGGEIWFEKPLDVGDEVVRTSTIKDIVFKTGKSGSLCFVNVDHVYRVMGEVIIRERQDIVYREAAKGPAISAKPSPVDATLTGTSLSIEATPTLLFRYSAVTFNAHRIHYDRDYARDVEFYDGLVVHGPLQATYAMRLAEACAGTTPKRFSYRGLSPLTDGAAFTVHTGHMSNDTLPIEVRSADGRTTFKCEAEW